MNCHAVVAQEHRTVIDRSTSMVIPIPGDPGRRGSHMLCNTTNPMVQNLKDILLFLTLVVDHYNASIKGVTPFDMPGLKRLAKKTRADVQTKDEGVFDLTHKPISIYIEPVRSSEPDPDVMDHVGQFFNVRGVTLPTLTELLAQVTPNTIETRVWIVMESADITHLDTAIRTASSSIRDAGQVPNRINADPDDVEEIAGIFSRLQTFKSESVLETMIHMFTMNTKNVARRFASSIVQASSVEAPASLCDGDVDGTGLGSLLSDDDSEDDDDADADDNDNGDDDDEGGSDSEGADTSLPFSIDDALFTRQGAEDRVVVGEDKPSSSPTYALGLWLKLAYCFDPNKIIPETRARNTGISLPDSVCDTYQYGLEGYSGTDNSVASLRLRDSWLIPADQTHVLGILKARLFPPMVVDVGFAERIMTKFSMELGQNNRNTTLLHKLQRTTAEEFLLLMADLSCRVDRVREGSGVPQLDITPPDQCLHLNRLAVPLLEGIDFHEGSALSTDIGEVCNPPPSFGAGGNGNGNDGDGDGEEDDIRVSHRAEGGPVGHTGGRSVGVAHLKRRRHGDGDDGDGDDDGGDDDDDYGNGEEDDIRPRHRRKHDDDGDGDGEEDDIRASHQAEGGLVGRAGGRSVGTGLILPGSNSGSLTGIGAAATGELVRQFNSNPNPTKLDAVDIASLFTGANPFEVCSMEYTRERKNKRSDRTKIVVMDEVCVKGDEFLEWTVAKTKHLDTLYSTLQHLGVEHGPHGFVVSHLQGEGKKSALELARITISQIMTTVATIEAKRVNVLNEAMNGGTKHEPGLQMALQVYHQNMGVMAQEGGNLFSTIDSSIDGCSFFYNPVDNVGIVCSVLEKLVDVADSEYDLLSNHFNLVLAILACLTATDTVSLDNSRVHLILSGNAGHGKSLISNIASKLLLLKETLGRMSRTVMTRMPTTSTATTCIDDWVWDMTGGGNSSSEANAGAINAEMKNVLSEASHTTSIVEPTPTGFKVVTRDGRKITVWWLNTNMVVVASGTLDASTKIGGNEPSLSGLRAFSSRFQVMNIARTSRRDYRTKASVGNPPNTSARAMHVLQSLQVIYYGIGRVMNWSSGLDVAAAAYRDMLLKNVETVATDLALTPYIPPRATEHVTAIARVLGLIRGLVTVYELGALPKGNNPSLIRMMREVRLLSVVRQSDLIRATMLTRFSYVNDEVSKAMVAIIGWIQAIGLDVTSSLAITKTHKGITVDPFVIAIPFSCTLRKLHETIANRCPIETPSETIRVGVACLEKMKANVAPGVPMNFQSKFMEMVHGVSMQEAVARSVERSMSSTSKTNVFQSGRDNFYASSSFSPSSSSPMPMSSALPVGGSRSGPPPSGPFTPPGPIRAGSANLGRSRFFSGENAPSLVGTGVPGVVRPVGLDTTMCSVDPVSEYNALVSMYSSDCQPSGGGNGSRDGAPDHGVSIETDTEPFLVSYDLGPPGRRAGGKMLIHLCAFARLTGIQYMETAIVRTGLDGCPGGKILRTGAPVSTAHNISRVLFVPERPLRSQVVINVPRVTKEDLSLIRSTMSGRCLRIPELVDLHVFPVTYGNVVRCQHIPGFALRVLFAGYILDKRMEVDITGRVDIVSTAIRALETGFPIASRKTKKPLPLLTIDGRDYTVMDLHTYEEHVFETRSRKAAAAGVQMKTALEIMEAMDKMAEKNTTVVNMHSDELQEMKKQYRRAKGMSEEQCMELDRSFRTCNTLLKEQRAELDHASQSARDAKGRMVTIKRSIDNTSDTDEGQKTRQRLEQNFVRASKIFERAEQKRVEVMLRYQETQKRMKTIDDALVSFESMPDGVFD